MSKSLNQDEAVKVEVTPEELAVGEQKLVEAKAKLKKNLKDLKETSVLVFGLSQVEAQAVNTVLHHIESTKSVPQQQVQGAVKELTAMELDLDLFKHIEADLSTFNNLSKTYRDVVKRIEGIEKFRTKVENYVQLHQKTLDFVNETIAKIKSHIVETNEADGIHVTYDETYFRPMLDLAYVIFDLVPTENGGVELKSKVKE